MHTQKHKVLYQAFAFWLNAEALLHKHTEFYTLLVIVQHCSGDKFKRNSLLYSLLINYVGAYPYSTILQYEHCKEFIFISYSFLLTS